MRFAQGCLVVGLLAVTGCGPSGRLAPVSGTVRYKGQPLPGAYVGFLPEANGERIATGTTDSGGRYRLTTFQNHDGAVLGRHQVVVRAEAQPAGPPRAADDITLKPGKLLTPPRYSAAATSGLNAVVAAKTNVFDFDLTD